MTFRNRAKCKHCGDVVESKYGHDFVTCSCYATDVGHGFFLDGGLGCDGQGMGTRCGGNFDDIEWMIEETPEDLIKKVY